MSTDGFDPECVTRAVSRRAPRDDDLGEAVAQRAELVEAHAQPVDDLRRDASARSRSARPGIGQRDVEGALVARAPLAGEVPLRLEPLQQGRQGGGLELQRVAEVAHRARAAPPEREHHQVLRVGQPERLEDRAVDADHAARRDREREADLVLEGEQVDGCRIDGGVRRTRLGRGGG